MGRRQLSVIGVLSLVVVSGVASFGAGGAEQPGSDRIDRPVNIQLARVLAGVFNDLLAASPTFRAQCARIASVPSVRVRVMPMLGRSGTQERARTTIRRFSSGALIAAVEIPVPLTMNQYAELLGHEFEHIVEQMDRVNLAALTLTGNGAHLLSGGAYETRRAQRAGLVIADERQRTLADLAVSADLHPRPAMPTPVLPVVAHRTIQGQR